MSDIDASLPEDETLEDQTYMSILIDCSRMLLLLVWNPNEIYLNNYDHLNKKLSTFERFVEKNFQKYNIQIEIKNRDEYLCTPEYIQSSEYNAHHFPRWFIQDLCSKKNASSCFISYPLVNKRMSTFEFLIYLVSKKDGKKTHYFAIKGEIPEIIEIYNIEIKNY